METVIIDWRTIFADSQQQGVDAWPYFEAWEQQWTFAGPGCKAWEEKGAQITIWCVGQKFGYSKCRMNNHIYYKDRKYVCFNNNNHHDKILISETGGHLKWHLIGLDQSETLVQYLQNYKLFYVYKNKKKIAFRFSVSAKQLYLVNWDLDLGVYF